VELDPNAEAYDKYAPELIRFATTLVGPSGAEDLVSTVFVRLVASGALGPVANRRAYLYRSLVNEARSRHRSTQRRLARESAVSAAAVVDAVDVEVDVLRALRRLSVRQRAVLWMAYWLDAPVREIASTLGVPLRTVERDLRAARNRLERDLS
jgi:RNA polymerase sigma-70 factor (ECF subfamily)